MLTELDSDGTICRTTSELLDAAASFYHALYRASPTSTESADRLVAGIGRTLTDEDSESLDRPFYAEEIRLALSSMATNKSPGIVGLPVEFYRRFWVLLEDDTLAVYDEALATGRLGLSQRTGVIRLLYKKGDRRDLRNWRPISLLTSDYTILAKAMASRLSSVLPSIVHEDQTCSFPVDRYETVVVSCKMS